jgi:two-component system response regulator FlrC
VDDEKDICEKLAASFELEDFKCYTANSGKQAVEFLKQNGGIHFIISDVKMPDGDGFYLLDYIRDV